MSTEAVLLGPVAVPGWCDAPLLRWGERSSGRSGGSQSTATGRWRERSAYWTWVSGRRDVLCELRVCSLLCSVCCCLVTAVIWCLSCPSSVRRASVRTARSVGAAACQLARASPQTRTAGATRLENEGVACTRCTAGWQGSAAKSTFGHGSARTLAPRHRTRRPVPTSPSRRARCSADRTRSERCIHLPRRTDSEKDISTGRTRARARSPHRPRRVPRPTLGEVPQPCFRGQGRSAPVRKRRRDRVPKAQGQSRSGPG